MIVPFMMIKHIDNEENQSGNLSGFPVRKKEAG